MNIVLQTDHEYCASYKQASCWKDSTSWELSKHFTVQITHNLYSTPRVTRGICKTRNKQLSVTTVFHYKRLYYNALRVSNGIFLSLNANMHT